jgi:glucose-6-phosphate-specific signal transduction histidine kinase
VSVNAPVGTAVIHYGLVVNLNDLPMRPFETRCKHSMCSRLDVGLKYSQDLKLRVSDDGVGMDPSVADRDKDGQMGLKPP